MKSSILDKETSKNRRVNKNLIIPLSVLWLSLLWSAYLDGSIYLLSLILTIIATLTFFINEIVSFSLVISIFLIGLIRVIAVFPYEVTFEILNLKIDILCFVSLVIALVLNKDLVKRFLVFSQVDESQSSNSRITYFQNKFSEKSTQELMDILENKNLVSEAREAAQILLSSKE